MNNNCFVGAGLSALFAQIFHWREGDICIYPSTQSNPFNIRRYQLDFKKPFQKFYKSYGSVKYNIHPAKLHDMSCIGGNSNLWGGFFDTQIVKNIDKLTNLGINLIPLNFKNTGSSSNIKSIVQLQQVNGEILNASNYLKPGISNYLLKIEFPDDGINLLFSKSLGSGENSQLFFGKVFICTGVIQTIDLLMRSNLIKKGDRLSLDEFEYELKMSKNRERSNLYKQTIISFSISRALQHYLGLQKSIFNLKYSFPNSIKQFFYSNKKTIHLSVFDNEIILSNDSESQLNSINFGKSIHYCNLRINGKNLNTFIRNINPNLYFVGMASVSQTNPGPISSDIYKLVEEIPSFIL